ncbi:solute carrier family 25 member 51 [Aythya fuligula]|uniref:Solute carrier family 25 member 51 n=1 Tax=Aythya fuligula TaxID=219594 RepID=A0A6J3EET3_AYTFU|nr:solute carrier family 25 member 51 [Aythya fuligula]
MDREVCVNRIKSCQKTGGLMEYWKNGRRIGEEPSNYGERCSKHARGPSSRPRLPAAPPRRGAASGVARPASHGGGGARGRRRPRGRERGRAPQGPAWRRARAQEKRTEIYNSKKNSMMDSEGFAPVDSKEELSSDIADTSGKHYLCGYCAAFTNIAVTFPIQKVLFRQQLYGLKTKDAVHQLQKDGMRNLYRGILPPLMQKTTTLALMFGLYEDFSSLLHSHTTAPELLTRSMAAVLAGTTEAVLTPFERVQTLLQDYKHHDKFTNTYQAFKVLKVYGMREYYRGLVPILLRNGPSNVLFFGLRGPIKQCLPEATSYSTHLVNDFICGGLLGAMLGFLFFPVNVVKARMQAQIGGEFQSFSTVFVKIWLERDRKLINLFRGAHLNYHRSVLSWGIINATYEFLLKLL